MNRVNRAIRLDKVGTRPRDRNDLQVHTIDDGRGRRDVYLDGVMVRSCIYANERKGKVRVYAQPMRLHRWRKRVITRTLYGHVRVVPCACEERGPVR